MSAPMEGTAIGGRLGERHMDRRHPLWQLTLVDGLADGRQAAIYRVQHAPATLDKTVMGACSRRPL